MAWEENWNTDFRRGNDYGSAPVKSSLAGAGKANNSFVGNLSENALFPPNTPIYYPSSGAPLTSDYIYIGGKNFVVGQPGHGDSNRHYNPTGYANGTRIYSAVRNVFGTIKVTPDIAAEPYRIGVGDSEELFMIFDFGYGRVELEDVKLGNTPIDQYEGVDYKIHYEYKNEDLDYYQNDHATQEYSDEITGDWQTFQPPALEAGSFSISITHPGGLYRQRRGRKYSYTARFQLEWRIDGGIWNPLTAAYRISASHRIRKSGSDFWLKTKLTDTFTQWLRIEPTETTQGLIEFRIRRSPAPLYPGNDFTEKWKWNYIDRTDLTEIGAVSYRNPLNFKFPHTILELRFFASEELGGKIDNISAIGKRFIPVWDGLTWTNQHSRNPAWIVCEILRGNANPYPIPDERIDLPRFLEWGNYCDEITPQGDTRFTVDANMDSISTIHERVLEIMQSARASLTIRGGKYSVIWENWPTVPAQVFTPANSWGFEGIRVWTRPVDGLIVQWVNPDIGYQTVEDTVFDDGKDGYNSQFFETISAPHCSSWGQAYREGRYHLAVGKLRPEVFTITTDLESLICERGDLIYLQHDVPQLGGFPSRVTEVDIPQEVVSPNLIANGDFETGDLTGWTDDSLGTGQALVEGGQLRLISGNPFSANRGRISQVIPTETDKRYRIEILGVSGFGKLFQIGELSTQDLRPDINNVFEFTARFPGELLQIEGPYTSDQECFLDDVIVTEFVPPIGNPTISTREPIQVDTLGTWQILVRHEDATVTVYTITAQTDPYTVEVSPSPDKVNVGDMTIFGREGELYDEYLVKAIEPGEELTATLTLIPYSPEIQNADTGPIPPYNPPINEEDFYPGCITNVEIEVYFEYVDRQPMSTVIARWEYVPYAAFYEVFVSFDAGEQFILQGIAHFPEYVIWERLPTFNANYPDQDIQVKIIPVSTYGNKPAVDDCEAATFSPPYDTEGPGKPLFFAGNITGSTMHLSWLPPDDEDIAGYVIRFSPLLEDVSWDNAATEVELVPFDIHAVDVNARVGTYMIRTIDTSNNFSADIAVVRTTIPTMEGMNFVIEQEESPGFNGKKDLCEVDGLTLIPSQVSEFACNAQRLGIYAFNETIELGDIQQVYLSSKLQVEGGFCPEREAVNEGDDYDVNVQLRLSAEAPRVIADWPNMTGEDPIGQSFSAGGFGGWQRLTAGYYTGRVFQFRALLTSKDGSAWPVVSQLSVQIDVPDRVISGSNIPVDAGGTVVLFGNTGGSKFFGGVMRAGIRSFASAPAVAVTIENIQLGDYAEVSNINAEGFTVSIKDGTGTGKAGQIDYIAKGYGYGVNDAVTPIDPADEDDIREFPEAIIRPTNYKTEDSSGYVTTLNKRFRYRP